MQWATYHNFMNISGFLSVLTMQSQVLVLFIQFLATKLTALASVKNYVAGVKTVDITKLDAFKEWLLNSSVAVSVSMFFFNAEN